MRCASRYSSIASATVVRSLLRETLSPPRILTSCSCAHLVASRFLFLSNVLDSDGCPLMVTRASQNSRSPRTRLVTAAMVLPYDENESKTLSLSNLGTGLGFHHNRRQRILISCGIADDSVTSS